MVGVFDQVEPGLVSIRTIEDPVIGGRTTISGLTVQPSQGGSSDFPSGDPLVHTVGHLVGTEPVTPMFTETREAAQQDVTRFPWWLALLPLALAMF
jgi:hypothetical protein